MNAVLLQFIRRLSASDASPDAELLRRFARDRDEAAFASLLQRHGPMVFGVCRRLLPHAEDAEDAFQATFLVLARKAGAIASPAQLANWLYGVAYRVSLKVRVEATKRRAKERQVMPVVAQEGPDELWSDLRPVLDAEVSRLPEKPRTAFVLCYLEGRTNEEAAGLLGCPVGTVMSRLSTARERLRAGLTRRGIVVPAAVFAAELTRQTLAAAAPAPLAEKTLLLASGHAASAKIATLVEGVLHAMFWNKAMKACGLSLLVLTLLTGTGLSLFAWQAGADDVAQGKEPPQAAKPASPAVDRKDGAALVTVEEVIEAFETNDALADEQFNDQHVRVKGTVVQVRRSGPVYYLMMTPSTRSGGMGGSSAFRGGPGTGGRGQVGPTPAFVFPSDRRKELAKLRQGDVVTVAGHCKGTTVTTTKEHHIRFEDCRVIEVHPHAVEGRTAPKEPPSAPK